MWDHDLGQRVAVVLELIANPPNLRRQDNIEIFDGGKMIVDTGHVAYQFDDGTRAFYGTGLNLGLTIRFPTGEEVAIDIVAPDHWTQKTRR